MALHKRALNPANKDTVRLRSKNWCDCAQTQLISQKTTAWKWLNGVLWTKMLFLMSSIQRAAQQNGHKLGPLHFSHLTKWCDLQVHLPEWTVHELLVYYWQRGQNRGLKCWKISMNAKITQLVRQLKPWIFFHREGIIFASWILLQYGMSLTLMTQHLCCHVV